MDIVHELAALGLTKEQYEECINLIIEKKNGDNKIEWQEIIDKYGLPFSVVYLRKACTSIFGGAFVAEYFKNKETAKKISDDLEETIKSSVEVTMNKDGTQSSKRLLIMNDAQSKDSDFILNAHGFDPMKWRIVSLRNNIRQVISKQDGVVTLYASFLTVKPITELTMEQIKEFYQELVDMNISPVVKRNENYKSDGLMLEIPIQDVHFGKLGLAEDVDEPYNYNLAKERFSYVIDEIIKNVDGYDIEKIVFPIGNDYFHTDTNFSTTTAGTRQNTDLSPQLIFKYGLECLIENILKLSEIAPVDVFCVNGNHDFLSSYHAICSIDCYFKNNENVNVNTDTRPRKYVEFGSTLIGFSHGDKEKKRIEGLMQIEAREAWGRTKYHEFHLAHLHSEQTKEVNGVIIRHLSSFVGTDIWHREQGYVGAIKKNESFLWDKEKGLRNIIVTTVD